MADGANAGNSKNLFPSRQGCLQSPVMMKTPVLLALLFGLTAVFPVSAAEAEKPNIVLILADDLGYGDLSCYGATQFSTPNIDRLAAEGRRFTSGYCSASTCTPTRYSLLTGTYAFREEGTGIAPPDSPALIPGGTTTMASLLTGAGYATAVVGKWHLGLGGEGGPDWNGELAPGPLEIGFDHCFLLPTTNDRVPQVYVENHRVLGLDPDDPIELHKKKPSEDHPTGISHRDELKMDWTHGHNATIHNGISRIGFYTGGKEARFRDEDLADRWVEESVEWMEEHRDKPFFLFFSSHDIHVPRMPHERFQGKTPQGWRGDAILELDWCVGELVTALERLGIAEDTLVVFCSDNGPVLDDGYADDALEKNGDHRSGGPFSGGKYSIYEGGTRTPFLAWWPGRIEPAVSEEIVCTIDLPASFAAMAGASLPDDEVLDSLDLSDVLLGEEGAAGRESLVQQDNGGRGNFGYRKGKWKLQRHDSKKARNLVVESKLANTPVPKFQLFDLEKDPAEEHDVLLKHPEVAAEMKQELEEVIAAGRSR